MFNKLLFLLSILLCVSCNNASEESSKTIWVGGEVVNPKSEYVVLRKDQKILDTVPLNDKNFFLYEAKDFSSGFYSFQHFEYQMFFVEPGDSIIFRVNTVDFDESLTYTGKGADKNNLLMELFLINEAENKVVPSWYTLSPMAYESKLDSLKQIRVSLFEDFKDSHDTSDAFEEIVEANINYDYFSKKEMYVTANAANSIRYPDGFFDYRDTIDFGNEELRSYYPYYRFLNRYFDNIVYEKYRSEQDLDKFSYLHNYHKIQTIDSLVTNDSLKNNLLRTFVKHYLINGKDAENERLIKELFLKTNTNSYHHREIEALAEATMRLTPGNTVPNVLLVTTENTMMDLQKLIKKPTVLYFWSAQSMRHYKDIHSKAAELKDKYPEYDFIGINTDTHFKKWRDIVRNAGYNSNLEFQLENIDEAENKLVINTVNKSILVDKNGVILEGNANLFNPKMEELLLGYLNK
ncbi:TlpA family protein disulfide reductase [Altibacter lentus]|uniref:TlpA family protein disulfide reductase n=1 Tax=Altibacter lentus TaxID=1223410 RepID=UPI000558A663|nr:thioredoxin-like domain-containing protein [Altibacter lentus]